MTEVATQQPFDDAAAELAVQTFAMLADGTRLRIVWELSHGPLNVNELAHRVERAPATVSQHLAKLRLAGLVSSRRRANFIIYELADTHVADIVGDAVGHAEHSQLR